MTVTRLCGVGAFSEHQRWGTGYHLLTVTMTILAFPRDLQIQSAPRGELGGFVLDELQLDSGPVCVCVLVGGRRNRPDSDE